VSGNPSSSPQNRAGLLGDLIRELRLCWRLLKHPDVPAWAKVAPFIAIAYLLFPIDLLPDPMLGLGQFDDLAILLLGMELLVNLSPPSIVAALRHEIQYGRRPPGSSPSGNGARTVDGDYRVVDDEGTAIQDPRKR